MSDINELIDELERLADDYISRENALEGLCNQFYSKLSRDIEKRIEGPFSRVFRSLKNELDNIHRSMTDLMERSRILISYYKKYSNITRGIDKLQDKIKGKEEFLLKVIDVLRRWREEDDQGFKEFAIELANHYNKDPNEIIEMLHNLIDLNIDDKVIANINIIVDLIKIYERTEKLRYCEMDPEQLKMILKGWKEAYKRLLVQSICISMYEKS